MAQTGPIVWVPSTDPVVNPVDGTVYCDSGPLSGGPWLFGVVGQTDVSILYRVLAVNANKLIGKDRPAAGPVSFLTPNQIVLAQNEIVRVLSVGGFTAAPTLILYGILVD